jgi:hypothetical protein
LDAGRRYLLYLVLAAWGLAATVAFLEALLAAELGLSVQ